MTNRERYVRLLGTAAQGPNDKIQTQSCSADIAEALAAARTDLAYLKELEGRKEEINEIRRRAIEEYAEEGRIDIDQDARISEVDNENSDTPGTWVQAWVWVPADPSICCGDCGKKLLPRQAGLCDACAKKAVKPNK